MTNEDTDIEAGLDEDPGFIIPEKWYKRLNWFVRTVLPAFATLYAVLGNQFEWTNVESVVVVCAAMAAFIGTIMGINARRFTNSDARFAGVIEITETEDRKLYNLVVNGDPDDIDGLKEVTFKVKGSSQEKHGL